MGFRAKKIQFEGRRVFLRVLEATDGTEEYASWLNDPEVNKFLATKSATADEVKDYIVQKDNQDDALFFGIFLKENGAHIGTIKLEPIDLTGKKATIALMIGNKNYWGKGLMPEAMKLLIDYCFDELRLNEVNLGVLDQNLSAIRVYEKLGFKETHRESKSVNYDGNVYDHIFMVLRKS